MKAPIGVDQMSAVLCRRTSRPCRGIMVVSIAATALLLLQSDAGLAALTAPPPSASLARTPSIAPDRRELHQSSVSMLTEPVERPLGPYLMKKDDFYNRVVPDWRAQYTTAEQRHLYGDDFALYVREVTDDGAVVQDAVTGLFGFVPAQEYRDGEPTLHSLIYGARCMSMDNTIIKSSAVGFMREQVGIVFEWDEEAGEGYILPEEEQNAFEMLRVLRRDILWHDSRRLFPGQFVQFQTVMASEVSVEKNEDAAASFALQVRAPEVLFTLTTSYADAPAIPAGRDEAEAPRLTSEPASQPPPQSVRRGAPQNAKPPLAPSQSRRSVDLAFADDGQDSESGQEVLAYVPSSGIKKSTKRQAATSAEDAWWMSGRQPPPSRSHPLLERFMREDSRSASAESPAWLWEPQIGWPAEDEYEFPLVPRLTQEWEEEEPWQYIAAHEVAVERGDTMLEPQYQEYLRKQKKLAPIRADDHWGEKAQRVARRRAAAARRKAVLDAQQRSQAVNPPRE